ncbi:uncharacterized protein TM35_000111790 [Trypanosoma theileri]|uniref:Uncharacterized protein n=1 Tax=Trypanosoma theileri TaxID=67003 RepID=A0A1X0NY85_9TRYP|nr:uncharacterized protein TM35_000111790 [Trypanosoma theileri]ORC89645.1 hypothetical protein TM35_000111790 [Trypanosoma theileri]
MLTAVRGVLGIKAIPFSRIRPNSHTTQEMFICVRRFCSHASLLTGVNSMVITQRRLNSTIHEGGSRTSSTPITNTNTTADNGSSNSNNGNSKNSSSSTSVNSNKPDQEAMDNLLEEIQIVLSRPVPIGSLFRALSSTSRKTLAKNREPLEQLLLRYPNHFAVYQQGNGRNRTIHCAPPHLVPAAAHRMVLEEPPLSFTSAGSSTSSAQTGKIGNDDINARILRHDPIAEKQQRINTVLQYIPNEWSAFTDLRIPEEVRVKCMGKPNVKAIQYFERYPQYFEVRQQSLAEHTFYVRRSLALQRSLEKTS